VKASKPRRGQPFHLRYPRRTRILAGIGAGLLALLVIFVAFDVPAALAAARDWVLGTFAAGLLVIAAWGIGLWVAIRRRAYFDRPYFARRVAGWGAAGLFAWGALAFNHSDWSLGGVDFSEASLGGSIGQRLIAGILGTVAWLSLFIVASVLLAPRASRAVAQTVPLWIEEGWRRRYPHRFFGGIASVVIAMFRMPERRPADDADPGGDEIDATGQEQFDASYPIVFRPSIDPAQPTAPVVQAGAVVAAEPQQAEPEPEPEEEPREAVQLGMELNRKPRWQYPDMGILNVPQPATHRKHDNAARAQLIVDTLASFGVDATVVEINEGPTVTQFGVEPGWEVRYRDLPIKDANGKTVLGPDGRPRTERVEVSRTRVRVNRITALQHDLALALAAPSLRIEAPVPGRAIVGIEVPNDTATVVSLRSVMETKEYADTLKKSKIAIALGRGVAGSPVVADLAKMPHLLIAGATGSGKSVCINAIVCGIMMNASPDEVRFVMVDPKRVELTGYGKIPHLAFSEVIVDVDKVVGTLQAVVAEMEARYKKFAELAVRNIEGYNKHPRVLKKLPYWVVIIDELADLMMAAPFEVEKLICRLAQLARATGIHLIVATQRPSVDVITGLIKANFPTRIAFAVTSMADSRTILDGGGAEKLLGRGDMLFMPTDASKPIRIQGVYVSDAEVERIVEFWTDDRFRELLPETADQLLREALIARNDGDEDIDVDEGDPILDRARELAMQHSRVSPSLFQRRLRVGYVKAAKLIEMLEDEGVVGSREEGESRRVLRRAGSDEPALVD
jgi:S-DNA-T family DNA segregation ATPase FtsK/SpoIIIE